MQLQYTASAVPLMDVLKFVIRHRKDGKAFKDWNYRQIAKAILDASNSNELYIFREDYVITGMAIARGVGDTSFYVDAILCSTSNAFTRLCQIGNIIFSGRTLTYHRRGMSKQLKRF